MRGLLKMIFVMRWRPQMHKYKWSIFLFVFLLGCENKVNSPTKKEAQEKNKWCTEAHLDLEKMMTALKNTLPKGEKASIKIPEKNSYILQCLKLPEDAQKCLVVKYAMANTKVCQNLTLVGKDKEAFEKLVSGK